MSDVRGMHSSMATDPARSAVSVAPAVTVRPTWARVDTAALAHNLAVVGAHVGPSCRVLAVVKADGYGCGATDAAKAFVDAGAWGLAVSLVEEGVELRAGRRARRRPAGLD